MGCERTEHLQRPVSMDSIRYYEYHRLSRHPLDPSIFDLSAARGVSSLTHIQFVFLPFITRWNDQRPVHRHIDHVLFRL